MKWDSRPTQDPVVKQLILLLKNKKKLNSNPVPRCALTKKAKKYKNMDVVGRVTSTCDRDRWSSLI